MIGERIRARRKQLRLSQQELACDLWTRSYISQIELGKVIPSLKSVQEMATRLDTTVSDLMDDGGLLSLAKSTLFQPQLCQAILERLPLFPTTIILAKLSHALQKNESPECKLPPNAELYYLTARVHIYQKNYHLAQEKIEAGINLADKFWRIRLLGLDYQICKVLGNKIHLKKAQQRLGQSLLGMDTLDELRQSVIDELKGNSAHPPMELIQLLHSVDWAIDLDCAFDLTNSDP